MTNQDVTDLFERVKLGTKVVVLQQSAHTEKPLAPKLLTPNSVVRLAAERCEVYASETERERNAPGKKR